jgi:uncharacterized protein (DUF427 family)
MAKATWKGAVLAESDATIVVEGNHYFPPESLRPEFFTPSDTHTDCPWKGKASYRNIKVDGELNADAAWYYHSPFPAAKQIKDYVAFWKGVRIER